MASNVIFTYIYTLYTIRYKPNVGRYMIYRYMDGKGLKLIILSAAW